jgi:PPOX class probable F420-dependent enzyme
MDADRVRTLFANARVARLATVDASGRPHLVPVTFAVRGDDVVTAIDHKPKSTHDLGRLRNIRENPQVSLLADHYEDDWTHLWWARADGTATVHDTGTARDEAIEALTRKYPQYRDQPPDGPVIIATITRWSGWSYSS